MFPRPFPRSVNLENLNCFSIIEGREEGGEKKKKKREKQRRDRAAVRERARMRLAGQLAAGRACPSPD